MSKGNPLFNKNIPPPPPPVKTPSAAPEQQGKTVEEDKGITLERQEGKTVEEDNGKTVKGQEGKVVTEYQSETVEEDNGKTVKGQKGKTVAEGDEEKATIELSLYLRPSQDDKLEDLKRAYKRITRKKISANEILRRLIDQASLEQLMD